MSGVVRVHVLISGRVQGVGYRVSTLQAANALKLSGWVRNLPDGRVEAVFEGTATQVEKMLEWCHQGVLAARVTDVAFEYEAAENLTEFRIIR